MKETMIRMNEKRYSMRTAAKVIGICEMTIYNRAKKLGIETKAGITAKDIKRIANYNSGAKQMRKGSVDELRTELEEMK